MPGQQGPVTNPRIAKLIELEVAGKIKPEHQQELDTYRAQGLAPKKSSGNNLTEYQGKSTGFYERAAGADADFLAAGHGGDPVGYGGDAARAVLPENVVNSNTSPERQKAEQAKRDFILASLRYESGAAINAGELEKQDKTFFPQTGDSAEVIAQKAAARKRVTDSLKVAAGPGVDSKRPVVPTAGDPAAQPSPDDKRNAEVSGLDRALSFDPGAAVAAGVRKIEGTGYGTPEPDPAGGWRVKAPGGTYATAQTQAELQKYLDVEKLGAENGGKDTDAFRQAYKQRFGEEPPLYTGATSDSTYGGKLPEAIEKVKKEPGSEVGSAVRGLANTVSFGLADPLDAAVNSLTTGDSFRESMQQQRASDAAAWKVNPIPSTLGTVAGAMMIPSRAGAVAATRRAEALTGGAAIRDAMSTGRNAGALQLAKEGGIYGATYGTAENLDRPDRFSRGAVSSIIGAGGGYLGGQVLGRIADRFGAVPSGGGAGPVAPPPGREAAEAANALDIVMPRYVAGGPATQQATAVLEKTPFGVGPIRRAQNKFIETGAAARDKIAADVGSVTSDPAMGDAAREGMQAWRKSSKVSVDKLYADARAKIGDALISPQNTVQEVGKLIREEGQSLVDTPAMAILDKIKGRLENGEAITVEGARKTRSTLRDALGETMTPSNADRITARVMDAIQTDVARDAPEAAAAFKLADKAHAERLTNIRDVLEPFIGKKGDAWGADVAAKLVSNAKSNGERLGDALKLMPQRAANDTRATLISHLGQSGDGAQNAAGDAFSFDTFLTNWNKIKDARDAIFPRETVRALNQLATVAEAAKNAGRARNFSNTGSIVGASATLGPALTGLHGMLATVGLGLAQYGGARLLASPAVVRRLGRFVL